VKRRSIHSSQRAHQYTQLSQAIVDVLEPRQLMSTYVVNNASDSIIITPGVLTLRQAIEKADAHPGADTITFSPAVFPPSPSHIITLTHGVLELSDTTGSTTIKGPGMGALTVNGNASNRVFLVDSKVTASIGGMTVTNGRRFTSAGVLAKGAGIYNAGTLMLNSVAVVQNLAEGGLAGTDLVSGGSAIGGGIYSDGSLALVNSSVTGNQAIGGGGFNQESSTNVPSDGGYASGAGIYATGLLSISGSLISGNQAIGGDAPEAFSQAKTLTAGVASGGGIYAAAGLSLSTSTVSGNEAQGGSAGYAGDSYASGAVARGGGIASLGKSTITDSTVDQNVATGGEDTANFQNEGFTGGSAFGGGVFTTAGLSITASTLTNNHVNGGIAHLDQGAQGGNPLPAGDASGGGVYSTNTLTLSQSKVTDNTVQGNIGAGGGVYASSSLSLTATTISGNTATGTDGNEYGMAEPNSGLGAGGGVYNKSTLTVTSSTISGNTAAGSGNEYYSKTGDPGEGGGIFSSGTSSITTSTIASNTAIGGIGGEPVEGSETPGNGGAGVGGGMYATASSKITFSTLSGNTARGAAGDNSDTNYGSNGGVATAGGIFSQSTLTIINSTLAANKAIGGSTTAFAKNGGNANAGAIDSTATLTLADTTISTNSAIGGTGGSTGKSGSASAAGIQVANGKATLTNTIVSNNLISGISHDIVGTVNTSTSKFNLIGVGGGLTNGVNGNKVGVTNPHLSSLGSHGGPTQTMIPLAGSPVINAGSNSLIPSGVTTDQRGFGRISGSIVDIGAVEYGVATIAGTVFNDANGNGKRDGGEAGLSGWVVYIDLNHDGKNDDGDPTATSSSTGVYKFTGLSAGTYTLRIVSKSGYHLTDPAAVDYVVTVASMSAIAGKDFGEEK
jgi:SdrD B-like domain